MYGRADSSPGYASAETARSAPHTRVWGTRARGHRGTNRHPEEVEKPEHERELKAFNTPPSHLQMGPRSPGPR